MEQMRWTPNQRDVIARLLGRDEELRLVTPMPTFPADIARRLQHALERDLAPVAGSYTGKHPLVITKHHLASVFRCEGFLVADVFEWSVQKLRGTVVHKA